MIAEGRLPSRQERRRRLLESLFRRRRRLVLTAVAVMLVAASPSLWSLTDSWARSTFPSYRMHGYRQQSLSEAEQARFATINEQLLVEEIGLPDPLVVAEVSHRPHQPEVGDRVYAVSTTISFAAPGPQEEMNIWYAAHGVGVAPADVVHDTVTAPIWGALDQMIAELEAAGFDRTYDEVRGAGLFVTRSVILEDDRARISFGESMISIKRFA